VEDDKIVKTIETMNKISKAGDTNMAEAATGLIKLDNTGAGKGEGKKQSINLALGMELATEVQRRREMSDGVTPTTSTRKSQNEMVKSGNENNSSECNGKRRSIITEEGRSSILKGFEENSVITELLNLENRPKRERSEITSEPDEGLSNKRRRRLSVAMISTEADFVDDNKGETADYLDCFDDEIDEDFNVGRILVPSTSGDFLSKLMETDDIPNTNDHHLKESSIVAVSSKRTNDSFFADTAPKTLSSMVPQTLNQQQPTNEKVSVVKLGGQHRRRLSVSYVDQVCPSDDDDDDEVDNGKYIFKLLYIII